MMEAFHTLKIRRKFMLEKENSQKKEVFVSLKYLKKENKLQARKETFTNCRADITDGFHSVYAKFGN